MKRLFTQRRQVDGTRDYEVPNSNVAGRCRPNSPRAQRKRHWNSMRAGRGEAQVCQHSRALSGSEQEGNTPPLSLLHTPPPSAPISCLCLPLAKPYQKPVARLSTEISFPGPRTEQCRGWVRGMANAALSASISISFLLLPPSLFPSLTPFLLSSFSFLL